MFVYTAMPEENNANTIFLYTLLFAWAFITHYDFQFLQLYHKMSLIKVAWYVIRVKNMHFGSTSDPWDPCIKAKQSCARYIIS